ncbi:MAG: phospho-N-acetylmuramoyl-pentapeptide-transferase [Clostridia bacterium]|nr:phospho-N-acetylmuramoyl-pentapeptide-transferase [Clostridia bacterium]
MLRIALTIVCAFIATLAIMPIIIPWLKKLKFGQNVRFFGPQSHFRKQGVPTMGGILIAAIMAIGAMVFSHKDGRWDIMGASVLFMLLCSLIGFIDDYTKIAKKNSNGLRARDKTWMLLIICTGYAFYLYNHPQVGSAIYIPFFEGKWDMGWLYIPFAVLVLYACINSANLVDGEDGLLSGVTLVMGVGYTLICYFMGEGVFMNMSVLAAALVGSCLGFLIFNHYPAKIMMGDTGSFAIGGSVACISMVTGMPLFLVLIGIMYVVTSASDIIQALSYKLRNKPVFKLAPLHHHLELSGWKENKIVAVYMILTAIFTAIAFLAAM